MSLVGRGDVGLPPAVSRGAEGIFLEECFEKRFFSKTIHFPVSLGESFPKFSASNSAWKGK
jgi:hypothetical protein